MDVVYFSLEALPHKAFFRCERQRASITTEACASMWRREADNNDGAHSACRLCPVGAVHAGEVAASMSPLKGTLTCSRCHRTASRLISGMHCPSCYNRQREFSLGCNAKGTAPVKLRALDARRVRYRHGDEVRTLRMSRTVDIDELIVSILRDSRQRVVFGFNSAPPPSVRQARLW